MKVKEISPDAVPRALELAERYRLLNEPEQAESICHDVLAVDPENQIAIRTLLLAISDEYSRWRTLTVKHAQDVAARLTDPYERHYYTGVVIERYARAKMHENQPSSMVVDWIDRAMEEFEQAEAIRPPNNDAAILRWNTCARLLERLPKAAPIEQAEIFDYA